MTEQSGKEGYLATTLFMCVCVCVFVFGGRELINPVANMITLQPCGLGVNTNTHVRAHTHTHTRQARPHCLLLRVSWLGDPTETDSTKISLQGSHVNTSRCNINSISHGKSPSGMAARGASIRELLWQGLRDTGDRSRHFSVSYYGSFCRKQLQMLFSNGQRHLRWVKSKRENGFRIFQQGASSSSSSTCIQLPEMFSVSTIWHPHDDNRGSIWQIVMMSQSYNHLLSHGSPNSYLCLLELEVEKLLCLCTSDSRGQKALCFRVVHPSRSHQCHISRTS